MSRIFYQKYGKNHLESYPFNENPDKYLQRFPGSILVEPENLDPELFQCYDIDSSKKLKLSLKKAKIEKKKIIREQRKEEFKKLDSKYIELLSQDLDLQEVKKRQKYLRDLPNVIDSVKNIKNLKNIKIVTDEE